MKRSVPVWAGLGLALSLALAACGQAPDAAPDAAAPAEEAAAPADAGQVAAPAAQEDANAAPPAAPATEDAAPVVAKTKMEATDPQTVAFGAGEVQFVKVFAFWWVTCQAMAPVVHGLEADYAGKVSFVYLDRDDPAAQPLIDRLGAKGQPRFYLLDAEGQVVEEWRGSVDKAEFVAAIDGLLAQSEG